MCPLTLARIGAEMDGPVFRASRPCAAGLRRISGNRAYYGRYLTAVLGTAAPGLLESSPLFPDRIFGVGV